MRNRVYISYTQASNPINILHHKNDPVSIFRNTTDGNCGIHFEKPTQTERHGTLGMYEGEEEQITTILMAMIMIMTMAMMMIKMKVPSKNKQN